MNTSRLKDSFTHSARHMKIMVVAGSALALSTFLPWYQDVDTYRTGDQFLGVTGPTSTIGFSILALSLASVLLNSYAMLGKKLIKLPWKDSSFNLFASIQSIFLLIVTNSIFFNPQFGINITLKESQFGMTIAFISSIAFVVGAYMSHKDAKVDGDNILGTLSPLISFGKRSHSSVSQEKSREEESVSAANDRQNGHDRSFVFGSSSGDSPSVTARDAREEESLEQQLL